MRHVARLVALVVALSWSSSSHAEAGARRRGGPELTATAGLELAPDGWDVGWRLAAGALFESGVGSREWFGAGLRTSLARHGRGNGGSQLIVDIAPVMRIAIDATPRLRIHGEAGVGYAYIESEWADPHKTSPDAESHVVVMVALGAAWTLTPALDLVSEIRVSGYTYNPGMSGYVAVPVVGIRFH